MTNPPIFFEKVKLNMIWVVQASLQKMIKGRCQKKTGKCGNFEKTGGGLPKSHFFCNLTKCFLACQIHSEVLKNVLQ